MRAPLYSRGPERRLTRALLILNYRMNLRASPSYFLPLCLLFVLGCTSNPSPTSHASTSENLQVRAVLQSYVGGRQARELKAVEAVLDPEVDQLTSRGTWRRGRDAATSGMKESTSRNPGDRTLHIEAVRFLRPDVALADARYVIKGTEGPDRLLWSSFTLVKDPAAGWRITSIRNQKPAE